MSATSQRRYRYDEEYRRRHIALTKQRHIENLHDPLYRSLVRARKKAYAYRNTSIPALQHRITILQKRLERRYKQATHWEEVRDVLTIEWKKRRNARLRIPLPGTH